jgi:hypothetical protein
MIYIATTQPERDAIFLALGTNHIRKMDGAQRHVGSFCASVSRDQLAPSAAYAVSNHPPNWAPWDDWRTSQNGSEDIRQNRGRRGSPVLQPAASDCTPDKLIAESLVESAARCRPGIANGQIRLANMDPFGRPLGSVRRPHARTSLRIGHRRCASCLAVGLSRFSPTDQSSRGNIRPKNETRSATC